MQADISAVPRLRSQRQLLPDQRQHRRIGEMEQRHAKGEDQQRPAASSASRPSPRAVIPVRAARQGLVDPAGRDRQRGDDARQRHAAQQPEHRDRAEPKESTPAAAAEAALPAWLKASFRPMRRLNAARPTRPSVMAAIAGAKTAAAMPLPACSAATGQKPGKAGISRQAAVTTSAARASTARRAATASTSAPAGAWASSPATPEWRGPRRSAPGPNPASR